MKTHSIFVSMGLTLSLIGGLSFGVLSSANAEPHPHYLHALSDLRYARAWLTPEGGASAVGHEADAIADIDQAIADIKNAAIDDGKDLNDHPSIDAHLKHRGRLQKAMALLSSARKDLQRREGNTEALGWRRGAINHVGEAIDADRLAIHDLRRGE